MTRSLIVAALALIDAACTSAPTVPSWQADVLPVIAANCVKCHGYPSQFGAPAGFRLDAYDDASGVDDHGLIIHGASTMYYRIQERVDDGTMPPALPLTGDDQAILDNWAAQATPAVVTPITSGGTYATFPVRSGTRPASNRPPTIVVTATATPGVLHYVIDDADHDLVEGQLQIGGVVIARHLRAGQGDVAIDTSQVPDGQGQHVDAFLDDGFPAMQAGVFALDVAGNSATPIAIAFNSPAPLAFVAQADAAQVDVCANQAITAAVSAVDPHGVRAPVVLDAAYAVPVCVVGASPTTVPWQTFKDGLSDGITDWAIQVVPSTDAKHAATSPTFRIQHGAATGTFADVKSIFQTTCGSSCHLTCGAYPATLPYDFNDYTDSATRPAAMPCGPFLGVGSMKGLIYDHVVVREDMPPGDSPRLSDDDRKRIAAWFAGGAQP